MTHGPIDHENRRGQAYSPKPLTSELRQKRSDAMKAFHRKTGKGTLNANRLLARCRKATGKQQ